MRLMDVFFALSVALLAAMLTTGPATAGVKELSGTYSASTVKADCDAAGGKFIDSRGTNGGVGGYSCVGSGGTVDCGPDGKCVGTCGNCSPSRNGTIKFRAIVGFGHKMSGAGATGGKTDGSRMRPRVMLPAVPSVLSSGGGTATGGRTGGGPAHISGGIAGGNAGMKP